MNDAPYLALTLIFTTAGIVKGITGMGLPTVAVALLGLLMPLPSAAALLIVPSLLTNVIQLFTGPPLSDALRRLAPMMLCIAAATLAASGLLLSNPQWSACALGAVLVIYALTALFAPAVQVSPPAERWLSPLAGALTGLITGATGVFVLPAVPYLQTLGLDKARLVQALGLSFTVSTLALWAGLWLHNGWQMGLLAPSVWATVPAIAGMWIGQKISRRLSAAAFRRCFLGVLLLLGAELILRPLAG